MNSVGKDHATARRCSVRNLENTLNWYMLKLGTSWLQPPVVSVPGGGTTGFSSCHCGSRLVFETSVSTGSLGICSASLGSKPREEVAAFFLSCVCFHARWCSLLVFQHHPIGKENGTCSWWSNDWRNYNNDNGGPWWNKSKGKTKKQWVCTRCDTRNPMVEGRM